MRHLYKYRSLRNIRFFLDIILNERLYAAKYDELNDPMEGWYISDVRNEEMIRYIKSKKNRTRICSLSRNYTNTLLWSYYADGHHGCCLEISAKSNRKEPAEVKYEQTLPHVCNGRDVEELLSYKSHLWNYEDEVRYFQRGAFLSVNVHRIIFGIKVSEKDVRFYTKLIHAINKNIEVVKMNRDMLDSGFHM